MNTQILLPGGKDFDGTDYIYVYGNGTPNENGIELLEAINKANSDYYGTIGSPGAPGKIQKVVIGPGRYNFTGKDRIDLYLNQVNLRSLTGERDVFLSRNNNGLNRTLYAFDINQTDNPAAVQNDYQLALDQIQINYPNYSLTIPQKDISFSDGSFIGYMDFYQGGKCNLFRIFPDGTYTTNILNNFFAVWSCRVVNDQLFMQFSQTPLGTQRLIKIDGSLNVDGSFSNPQINSGIQDMIQPGGIGTSIYIVGQFTTVSGFSRGRYAKLNSNGSIDLTFNSSIGANNSVMTATYNPANNTLMIGGWFNQINGISRQSFAYIDVTTGADITSSINASFSINNAVLRIEYDLNTGYTLLFGNFWIINGNGVNSRTARINSAGVYVDQLFNGNYVGQNWDSMYCNPSESSILKIQNQSGNNIFIGANVNQGNFFQWDIVGNNYISTTPFIFTSSLTFVNSIQFYPINQTFAIAVGFSFSFALIPLLAVTNGQISPNLNDDDNTICGIYIDPSQGCLQVQNGTGLSIKNYYGAIYGENELSGDNTDSTFADLKLNNCNIPTFGVGNGNINALNSSINNQVSSKTIVAIGSSSNRLIFATNTTFNNFYYDSNNFFSNAGLDLNFENCKLFNSFSFFTASNQYGYHSYVNRVKAKNTEFYSCFMDTYSPQIELDGCKLTDSFRIGSIDRYDSLFTWYGVMWKVSNCNFGYNCFTIDVQGGDTTEINDTYGSYGPTLNIIDFNNIVCEDYAYSAIPEFKLFLGSYNPNGIVMFNNINGAYGGSARNMPLCLDVEWGTNTISFGLNNITYQNCNIDTRNGSAASIFCVSQHYKNQTFGLFIEFRNINFINCQNIYEYNNVIIEDAFYIGTSKNFVDPLNVSLININFETCKVQARSAFISDATNFRTSYDFLTFNNCIAEQANNAFISKISDVIDTRIREEIIFKNCRAKNARAFFNDYNTGDIRFDRSISFINCEANQGFLSFSNFMWNNNAFIEAINCRVTEGYSFGKNIQFLYGTFRYCHGSYASFGSSFFNGGNFFTTMIGSILYCTGFALFGTDTNGALQSGGIAEFNSTGGSANSVSWIISNYNT